MSAREHRHTVAIRCVRKIQRKAQGHQETLRASF
jgi:hypothetical protein